MTNNDPSISEHGAGPGDEETPPAGAGDGPGGSESQASPNGDRSLGAEQEPSGDSDRLEVARDDVLDFLEGLLEAMGLDGEAHADIADDGIVASVAGGDLGILIGRHGQTLNALQELLRAAVQHQARERVRITLDIEGYRERRRETLERYAQDMAARAREEGGEIELDAMPAFERKVVHDTVAEIEGVTSFSEGEEPNRRVIIRRSEEAQ